MHRALSMDVRVGDSIAIDGGRVVITVEAKSGQRARLRLRFEQGVDVRREPQQSPASAAPGGVQPPER